MFWCRTRKNTDIQHIYLELTTIPCLRSFIEVNDTDCSNRAQVNINALNQLYKSDTRRCYFFQFNSEMCI